MPRSSARPATTEPGTLTTARAGWELLADPLLNKGTAFTEAERDAFDLHGLLAAAYRHARGAGRRAGCRCCARFATDLERYAFLRDLQDTNETLFYALLQQNIEEIAADRLYADRRRRLPAVQPDLFRKPRGLFLSLPQPASHRADPGQPALRPGRGDRRHRRRAHPRARRPGRRRHGHPDRQARALHRLRRPPSGDDPADHARRRHRQSGAPGRSALHRLAPRAGARRGLRRFRRGRSSAPSLERWPHVLLQWEDFASATRRACSTRYRDRLCTFNDDIQGTAAVAAGTLLAAINVTGVAAHRAAHRGAGRRLGRLRHRQPAAAGDGRGRPAGERGRRAVLHGRSRRPPGRRHERDRRRSSSRSCSSGRRSPAGRFDHPDKIALLDVVRNAKPTVLIGVSGQPGAFSEAVVRAMAEHNRRPVIFPLSNPTSRAEATPDDLEAWTEGRAVIGTGSPFPPVDPRRRQVQGRPDQQFLHLSGRRARRGRGQGAGGSPTGCSWPPPRPWPRPRRRADNPRHNLLPPVTGPAPGRLCGGTGDRDRGAPRGADPGDRDRPDRGRDPRQDVGPALSPLSPRR